LGLTSIHLALPTAPSCLRTPCPLAAKRRYPARLRCTRAEEQSSTHSLSSARGGLPSGSIRPLPDFRLQLPRGRAHRRPLIGCTAGRCLGPGAVCACARQEGVRPMAGLCGAVAFSAARWLCRQTPVGLRGRWSGRGYAVGRAEVRTRCSWLPEPAP
jgi:hypothetical protein